MMNAPIPDNEADRLQVLRELLILDTPPEERFDRIVEFAAEEFGVPIALISLVDDNRQWFKARFGLAVCETDRKSSFCGHAIHVSEVMVVEDATQDPASRTTPWCWAIRRSASMRARRWRCVRACASAPCA
ncbi:GAF domain-containing protein [Roseateles chitinivorans]|uniref:GAF domain-containing protein n=1 Tax=Roseateles chitinivorans TaxID=2917965 RepID=UPI003D67C801